MTPLDNDDPFKGPDEKIGAACRSLIREDEKITIRSIARELGVAHTTLSRNKEKKIQIEKCAAMQETARIIETKQRRQRQDDYVDLAKANQRIAVLERQVSLLTASHKAMILAVGEIGGMSGWKRFFPHYAEIEAKLRELGAMPSADVVKLTKGDDE